MEEHGGVSKGAWRLWSEFPLKKVAVGGGSMQHGDVVPDGRRQDIGDQRIGASTTSQ
jgi:hypothetical protein